MTLTTPNFCLIVLPRFCSTLYVLRFSHFGQLQLHRVTTYWKKNISPITNLAHFSSTYTVVHMFRQVLFGAGNQSNHQTFEKSLLSCKCELIFIAMKQNFFFFLKNKIQNGRLKKTEIFNYPQKLSNCRQNFTDWSLGQQD